MRLPAAVLVFFIFVQPAMAVGIFMMNIGLIRPAVWA
jgi:hypothetical protein